MTSKDIYKKLSSAEGTASLLELDDFGAVYELADRVRREAVGDVVHLRAIIEFSNVCKRQCRYCGLNRDNKEIQRYRMSRLEILDAAHEAVEAGYRTIVLQSGEDDGFAAGMISDIVSEIKKMELPQPDIVEGSSHDVSRLRHPAVTLSCGERTRGDYEAWRRAGADRYLLKHETADPELYDRLHPCGTLGQRVGCLKVLKELGYETGSGFMVGLPGQTALTLAEDLMLLKELSCEMAGIGPFISNPKTPLAGEPDGDPEMARRVVAIARLLLPGANLPLTTALAVMADKDKDEGGKTPAENPFSFGANVVMKKVTPDKYKEAYEIYPAVFKSTNVAEDRRELERMIRECGREPL